MLPRHRQDHGGDIDTVERWWQDQFDDAKGAETKVVAIPNAAAIGGWQRLDEQPMRFDIRAFACKPLS
jgi:hypothetical protein